MNKQEAIKKIKQLPLVNYSSMEFVEEIINIISQIDEPERVVVPKFVAEWIEGCKQSGWHLEKVLYRLDDDEKVGDWAYDKNDDLIPEKVDMIAHAWLDGYEIEQEKLYTVEIAEAILTKITRGSNVQYKMLPFGNVSDVFDKAIYTTRLTEQEIKQKDERLWQWAEPVEVE